MLNDQIAKVAHEVNKAYCESIGDNSQVSWIDAPDWQKKSAINGVVFHQENPDSTPEDSHISWLQEKLADDWKWGLVKNADKKEHPCIMPYEDLPTEDKSKDYIFRAIVKTMSEI